MDIIAKYILFFMIYSFLGWLMEVIVTLVSKNTLVNRGFLIGPYCPIYGYGVILILLIIGTNSTDYLAFFLKSVLICSVLEYFTSFFMEKFFNVRWWDYSDKKFNINGRICLETMIPFGIGAFIVNYLVHPKIDALINLLSPKVMIILAIVFVIIYIIDNILSTYILINIKGKIRSERKDNTEKIRKYVEKWIQDKSILYRRIKNAFPKFEVFKKIPKDK